jgi:hypothetical protein
MGGGAGVLVKMRFRVLFGVLVSWCAEQGEGILKEIQINSVFEQALKLSMMLLGC